MKRHSMPEIKEGGVNVTPLIDVVMCLIIFFMLVAKIGVSTGAEKMDLPSSILGTDIKDMGNTLTLNVRPGPLEDQPIVTALVKGEKRELKLFENRGGKQVRPLFEVLKAMREGGMGFESNKEFKVIIRGEAEMAYRYLEPVLMTCAEANVKNVNFNTKKVEQIQAAPAVTE